MIPAHDEAGVIDRLLRELAPAVENGVLRVVVVANGCRDATASVARRHPGVVVVETPVGSKPHALNLGDDVLGDLFPRAYVDADVILDPHVLEATFDALERDGALAAAPAVSQDLTGASRWARRYARVLRGVPTLRSQYIGSGCYVLSQAGRARFGPFPDVVGDDRFVNGLFAAEEKVTVADHPMTVFPPRS